MASFDPSWLRQARLPLIFIALAELVLIAAIVWASVALFWVLVRPYGPVGPWTATVARPLTGDYALLSRFDPFFRLTPATGPAAVTSLPLKLTGVRIDEAMGRGSAIIGTPDGVQSSYAVGDEIVPGVRLKAVSFDNVTIDRGGTVEQLFIDQSVVAPVATSALGGAAPLIAGPAPTPVASAAPSLLSNFAFDPHIENGKMTGFVVQPKGNGDAFKAAGFQTGDLVTSIAGRELHGLDDATQAINSVGKDAILTFAVQRAGKTVTLSTRTTK